jgi:hypothetical protein
MAWRKSLPASSFGAVENLVEPGGGDRRCLASVLVGFENGGQIAQLLLQRTRQRGVDAVTHRHEAVFSRAAVSRVSSCSTSPSSSVACPERRNQSRSRLTRTPSCRVSTLTTRTLLPLGHSTAAIAGSVGSVSTEAERLLGVFDQPLADAVAAVEEGQGVEDRFEMLALAQGRVRCRPSRCRSRSSGGVLPLPAGRRGPSGRAASPPGAATGGRRPARVRRAGASRCHLPGGLRRVGVHLETSRPARARSFRLLPAPRGHGREWQSAGNEVRGLLLRGREAHQPQALRAVLDERDQAQRFVSRRSSASST